MIAPDFRAALRDLCEAIEGNRAISSDRVAAYREMAAVPFTVAELQVHPLVVAGSHAFVADWLDSGPIAMAWMTGEVDGPHGPHAVTGWWFLPCDADATSLGMADGWEFDVWPLAPVALAAPARIVEVRP